jgi:hypothetical protein
MENEKRKDPLTGESFTPTRSNQFYANRKNQIKFNNQKQKRERKENIIINRYLLRNKKILKYLLSTNKEMIKSKDFLLGAGFKFEYYTHFFRYGSGYAYCYYDYCTFDLGNNSYKIFKNV